MSIQPTQKTVILSKMDSFDQLQAMDQAFKDKLVYAVTTYDEKKKQKVTKYELTYIGIKQLILEMSQKGQAMEIIEGSANVIRTAVDPTDPKTDVWYAEIKHRNKQTGQESWGVSEAFVFPWGNYIIVDQKTGQKQWNEAKKKYDTEYKQQYDPFGRTGSVSKATRNSLRQQIPEMAIQLFVERAMKDEKNVQKIDDDSPEMDPSIASNFCQIPEHKPQHDTIVNRCNECKKMVRMP